MRLMQYLSLTVLVSLGTVACAPASKAKKATAGGGATEVDDVTACSGVTGIAPTFKSAFPKARTTPIDPNSTTLLTSFHDSSSNESICQFLTSNNKEVVVFQFSGMLCESCKSEAATFTDGIAASSKGAKIAHVVIFVDDPSDPDMQEPDSTRYVNDFMLSNTQNKGVPRFEPSKVLFKQYNLYDDGVKFGSAIAINKFGQQDFINDSSLAQELLNKATQLVP